MKKIILMIIAMMLTMFSLFFISCGEPTKKPPEEETQQENTVCQHEYEETSRIEATCTRPAKVTYTCTKCGKVIVEEDGKPLGHDGEWVLVKEPTCHSDGKEERTCTRCGKVESRIVPSLNHKYMEDLSMRVEPDCTHNGKRVYKCMNDGCTETYEEIVFAKGHTPDGAGVIHNVTCTEDGYTEYHCSVCGATYKDNIIKAKGHVMEKVGDVEATCEHGPGEKFKCKNCDHVEYRYSGAKLDHHFDENGVCTLCNKSADKVNPIRISPDKYDAVLGDKENKWIFSYVDGVMDDVKPFDLTINSETVNALIKLGYHKINLNFSRDGLKATNFKFEDDYSNAGFERTYTLEKDTPLVMRNIRIINVFNPTWEANGYTKADSFVITILYEYGYNEDVPMSYLTIERGCKWNGESFDYNYSNKYAPAKTVIKKEHVENLKAKGMTSLTVRVTGGGYIGIQYGKDDIGGANETSYTFNLSEFNNKDIEFTISDNISSELKIFLEPKA